MIIIIFHFIDYLSNSSHHDEYDDDNDDNDDHEYNDDDDDDDDLLGQGKEEAKKFAWQLFCLLFSGAHQVVGLHIDHDMSDGCASLLY